MSGLPFCHICQKYFNSIEQRSIHENGQSHLAKLKNIEEQNSTGAETKSTSSSFSQLCDVPNARMYSNQSVAPDMGLGQDSGPVPSHFATLNDLCRTQNRKVSSELGADPSIRAQERFQLIDGNGQEYIWDRSMKRGKCKICDLDLTSVQHAHQHLSGKSHEKKRKTWQYTLVNQGLMPSEGAVSCAPGLSHYMGRNSPIPQSNARDSQGADSNIPMCKLCNAPFSSFFNMEQHFAGARHKKELRKRGMEQNLPFAQNVHNYDPEQTLKKEYIQSDVLNKFSPVLGDQILSPRIQPDMKSDHSVPENAGLCVRNMENDLINTQTHASTRTVDGGNAIQVQRSLSNNLSDFYDKDSQLKDKRMLLPGMKAESQHAPPQFASSLSSIVDNNQQPLLKYDATSQASSINKMYLDAQAHYSSTQNTPNRNAVISPEENSVLPLTSTPDQRHGNNGNTINNPSRRREYEFDGEKGYCYVCDVALTSLKLAQQHINGQQHSKKSERWVGMQVPLQEKVVKSMASKNTDSNRSDSPSHLSQSAGSQPQEYYHFDGNRGFCRACNSELSSSWQASQHLEGKPHKRNVLRMKTAEQGIHYPLYCQICQKPFTGQESALQHFISDKHQRNEDLFKSGSEVLEVFEGGRKLRKNREIWYFCDICRKVLNTFDQLNIHRRSHDLTELVSPRSSPRPRYVPTSNDTIGNAGTLDYPGMDGSDLNQSANFSPHSRQNSSGSSIDPQVPLTQIRELLTYGENPIVNTEHSSLRNDHFQSPQGMVNAEALPGAFVSEQVEGSRQIKGRGDFTTHSTGNRHSEMSNGSGIGFRTTRTNVTGDSSIDASMQAKRPTNYSEDHVTEGVFKNQENCSIFGKVTFGVRSSAGKSGSRERGHKNVVNLDYTEIEESSDDDDCVNSDTPMNIQGEERQSLEHPQNKPNLVMPSGVRNKYYCQLCERQMNAKKSYKEHLDGKLHQWKVSSTTVPFTLQHSIHKSCTVKPQRAFELTKTIPRTYQVKLMEKAMASDCVVFLPTGTGKTMVSVLTIGLMLEMNPRRPVIFLVDKVLLVIQQARYIKTEFEGKKFKRASLQRIDANCDEVEIVDRELSLAFVCGGLLCTNNLPIWQHDIIVTTVDYCINMLINGSIMWEDFCLAVVDEAHHCVKKHPYRRLIQDFHCKLDNPRKRPKILGLTASPAGKSSVDETYIMLQSLLRELGGAQIAFVGEEGESELKSYQSNTILHTFCVPLSDNEQHFLAQCIKYFLQCYMKLAPLSTTLKNYKDPPCSYFYQVLKQPCNEETLRRVTDSLLNDAAPLSEILPYILDATCVKDAKDREKNMYDSLRSNTFKVLLLIAEIPTGLNFEDVKKDFEESDTNYTLKHIKELGLPCDTFYKQVLTFEQEEGKGETTMVGKLTQILQDPSYIDWGKQDSMALVLVRERKQARSLSHYLKRKEFVLNNRLGVTPLVGHGKGGEDKGMAVKDQKKVLDNQRKCNILVATSIAEEGVDIKTVELVVSMNPPSNVTALVQMRGRARKKGSHFVILCSSEEEMAKLDNLRQQEINMMEAAKKCLENQ